MGTAGLAAAGGATLGILTPAPAAPAAPSGPSRQVVIGPPSGFAGYQVRGPVTEIAADWTVPEIRAESDPGDAGTWIGVENVPGDFIQVGTLEIKFDQASGPVYTAFWSDTSLGFHAQLLAPVRPGDLVVAEMTRTSAGWKLRIRDGRSALNDTFQSHYAPGTSFDAAEWTQEDPATRLGGIVDLPYPDLSTVGFSDLRLNGRRPRLSFSEARSLASPNGVYLVPGHPSGDSFTLRSATLDQAQYLEDVRPLNYALEQFDAAVSEIGPVPKAVATTEYESALGDFRTHVAEQSWPPRVERQVPSLVSAASAELRALRSWSDDESPQLLARIRGDSESFARVSHVVRAALGLPPR